MNAAVSVSLLPAFEEIFDTTCRVEHQQCRGDGSGSYTSTEHLWNKAQVNCVRWADGGVDPRDEADWGGFDYNEDGDDVAMCEHCGSLAQMPTAETKAVWRGKGRWVDGVTVMQQSLPPAKVLTPSVHDVDLDQLNRFAPWVFNTATGLELLGFSSESATRAVNERWTKTN